MSQRHDPGVHAGDDGDAGVGDAVEAGVVEGRGELTVGLEEVVEVVGHGSKLSGAQRRARSAGMPRVRGAAEAEDRERPRRRRRRGRRRGRSRAAARCRPARSAGCTPRTGSCRRRRRCWVTGCRPRRRSSAAARSWSAPRCRPASRPSGPPRAARWSRRGTPVVGAREQGGVDRGEREAEAEARPSPARPRRTGGAASRGPSRPSARSRAAASTMPTRGDRPRPAAAGSVRRRPAHRPGSATRNSTSTRAALICEPSATVIRAKIGMSTSAAISAAPTKKLTTIAPQAGRCGEGAVRDQRARSSGGCAARTARRRRRRSPRYQGPAGQKTCTSGSAVAKARMTPPRATESRPAPSRSASRTEPHQSRRSTSGRVRGEQPGERAGRPSTTVATPTWDAPDRAAVGERHERAARATTEVTRPLGLPHHQQQRRPGSARAAGARASRTAARADSPRSDARLAGLRVPRPRTIRTRRSAQGHDRGGEDEADGEVDPEDVAPGAEGEHHGAVQRAEHAAELLDGADDAERDAAAVGGVEVGDQGERDRHQAAAADALEEAAGRPASRGRTPPR